MASIPLVATQGPGWQAPRTPLEEASRAAQLQQQQQQLQAGQQEMQQREMQMRDQQAQTKAMLSWDGKSYDDLAKSVLDNGGSAGAVQGIQKHGLELKKTASEIAAHDAETGAKHIDTIVKQHDLVSGALQPLLDPQQVPDEQLSARLLETVKNLGAQGALDPPLLIQGQKLAQSGLPGDQIRQQLTLMDKNLLGSNEQFKRAQEERKTAAEEESAKARTAQAAKAPAGEQEFQAYYKSKLGASGQKPSAKAEFAARQEFAQSKRAPRNDQASADAIEAAAQSIASMNPKDLTRLKDVASMRGDQRLLIFNRAKQINPDFSTAEVDRKAKMLDSFQNGKDGQNLQSFGTFLEHAGEASRVANEFRTTSIPLVNTPLNKIRDKFGDATYTRMAAALEPVRKEFEGFLLGGRALYGDDRKAAETILSESASPAQIQAALKQMGHTVKARYNEVGNRFKNGMGAKLEDVIGPLSNEAMQGAKDIGIDMGGKKMIRARDPRGVLHEAPEGTALPQGWKAE
jgi:hypothetical protein